MTQSINLGDAYLHIVPILKDNYAYLIEWDDQVCVIDPGEAGPILHVIEDRKLRPGFVVSTHGHWDHVQGNADLEQAGFLDFYAPAAGKVPEMTQAIGEGSVIAAGPVALHVLETPGHTDHCTSLYAEAYGLLFCADLLFVGGCGRCFTGDLDLMWRSIQRLAALPKCTRMFCGHEYSKGNFRFAHDQLPQDPRIAQRQQEILALRERGEPTVPTTLAEECRTNIYLLATDPVARAGMGLGSCSEAEAFAEIRRRKDEF